MTSWHSSTPSQPTFVSLYSGAGGLDLGFAKAGFRPVFANDIAPDAVATHKQITSIRDPEWASAAALFEGCVATEGDIREVGTHLREGAADIVIGGPPCQGFSVAGKMDPNDPRSKHVFDFLGLVARIRPKAFVMENVSALAENRRWAEVIATLKEMASVEYSVQLVVLDASHWGVAQSRKRMFLIGLPPNTRHLDFSSPSNFRSRTVRDVLRSLPTAGLPGNESLCTARITLAKNPVIRRSAFAGMLFNGQGRVINLDGTSPTLPASMGGNRTPIIDVDALEHGVKPWVVQYHERLFFQNKSPLTSIPDNVRMRRITVQEAAAIQSFPHDMKWCGRQSSQYRQIGNAVPPLLAYAVAEKLRSALKFS